MIVVFKQTTAPTKLTLGIEYEFYVTVNVQASRRQRTIGVLRAI